MQRIAVTVALLVMSACYPVRPPESAPAPDATIAAPVDAVWSAVIEAFADVRVPIETIEKASGLVATRTFRLTFDQLKAWGNCGVANGKPLLEQVNAQVMYGTADFNVFVRPTADGTLVRVNLGVQGYRMNPYQNNQFTPDVCVSSGAFERNLLAFVQARTREATAPAAGASLTGSSAPMPIPAAPSGTSWQAFTQRDPKDGAVIVGVRRPSRDGVPATLVVQCEKQRLYLFATWRTPVAKPSAVISWRADQSAFSANAWATSDDGLASFYPRDVRDLLLQLVGRSSFTLQLPTASGRLPTSTFDLTGLSDALRPVLEACR